MKKFLSSAAALIVAASIFTGCTSDTDGDNEKNVSEATLSGTVSTDGSTSMEKVIGYLSEAYMEENPEVKVTYNPTGSGSGIQAVAEERCDIGLASRDLKEDEAKDLDSKVVAIDGIAVVVNPENSIADLTLEQIKKIYTGEIKNWSEIGGSDTPIVCIGREAASGTRDGFESITGTKDACVYAQELTSTGDVIQTVASNPNAIGYASLSSVKDTVKAVSVDGVTATVETIQDGSYKIQRDFNLVTKKGKALSETARSFYDFATSKEADSLIEKAGAIPVVR